MRKPKRLLASIFVAWILISIFAVIYEPVANAPGENWLYPWMYRKSHIIEHPVSPIEPVIVGYSNGMPDAIFNTAQRKAFYHDGHYFVFYANGTTTPDVTFTFDIVYKTSDDGIAWSDVKLAFPRSGGEQIGQHFSVFLFGDYVYFAYAWWAGYPPYVSYSQIRFQRGTVFGDSITWGTAYVVKNNTGEVYPTVTANTGGYPFVAWGEIFAYCSSVDGSGTWTTISTLASVVGTGLLQLPSWHVYLYYTKYTTWLVPEGGGAYYHTYRFYGREWDGYTLGSITEISNDSEHLGWQDSVSGTVDIDDNLHFAYNNAPVSDIRYRKRVGGSWQPSVSIGGGLSVGSPSIGIYDWDNTYINVVWADGNNIYTQNYTTSWHIPSIISNVASGAVESENSFLREYDGKFAVLWNTCSSGTVYFAEILNLPPSGANPGTNYQIKKYIHYGSGTSSGENVYLNGSCKTDFSDIRFTASDGITLLSAWNESQYNGDNVTVWFKVSENLTSNDVRIYLYYGNSVASAYWNGEATFILFDDFNDASLNASKWAADTRGSGTVTEPSGTDAVLTVHPAVSSDSAGIQSIATFTNGISIMVKRKETNNPTDGIYFVGHTLGSGTYCDEFGASANFWLWTMHSSYYWLYYNDVYVQGTGIYQMPASGGKQALSQTGFGIISNTYQIWEERYYSPSGSLNWLLDGISTNTATSTAWLNDAKKLFISAGSHVSGNYGSSANVDWVAVRKFVSPEPTNAASGSGGGAEGGEGGWGYEELPSNIITLFVSSSPEIHASFTMNGTSYNTPTAFYGAPGGTITATLTATEMYVACKWIFNYWLLNMSTIIYGNTTTISTSVDMAMTMVYTEYDTTWDEGLTTLNIDGNITARPDLNHTYYWNPHNTGTIDSWSYSFSSNDYLTLSMDTVHGDIGHIAAGTWWYTWNTSTVARQPINTTYVLEAKVRIRNATYANDAWMRMAIASAWCDPTNYSSYEVKYTELDFFDNVLAQNHEFGDAAGTGNVIFSHNDVVEWLTNNLSADNTWHTMRWNLTQYIQSAWGQSMQDGRLESVYLVIEIENQTQVVVDVKDFWLRTVNSTAYQYNKALWDSVASYTSTAGTYPNGTAIWPTIMKNSTGYSLFETLKTNVQNTSYMKSITDDSQAAFWSVNTTGTSSISKSDNSTDKINGTNSLTMVASRVLSSENCYINHTYTSGQDWTWDFLLFYMKFSNATGNGLYYHVLALTDTFGQTISWQIFDTNRTEFYDTWVKVTLPLLRPTTGSSFDLSSVKQICFYPNKLNGAGSDVGGWTATIKLDCFYIDAGVPSQFTFNIPPAATNITLSSRQELTGHSGKYTPFANISLGYPYLNTSFLQFLRPWYIKNWAPWNIYDEQYGYSSGITIYAMGFDGDTVFNNSVSDGQYPYVLINTGYGMAKKLTIVLKLPPNDGQQIVNGSFQQEYTFGSISELKIKMYVETDNTAFWDFSADDLSCGDWVITEYERDYTFSANVTVDPDTELDTLMMAFNDTVPKTSAWYYLNNGTYHAIGDSTGDSDNFTRVHSASRTEIFDSSFFIFKMVFKLALTDTWDCDLYAGVNTTLSSTMAFAKKNDLFNLYSKGGLEAMTTSDASRAGRLAGGDFFNLYAGNYSTVTSTIYWRNLVHFKMLVNLYSDKLTTSIPTWQFGIDYYARGRWNTGMSISISLAEWYDTADDKWARFAVNVYSGSTLILTDKLYSFADRFDTAAIEAPIWIDIWWNKANASSIVGLRATSEYYAMSNKDFWKFITGGTWGITYKNYTNYICYVKALDSSSLTLYSQEVEMSRVYAKVTYPKDTSEPNVNASVRKINVFDYTFDWQRNGIMTPSFEEPKMPTIALTGIFGALLSIFSTVLSSLMTVFSFVWSGVVWMLDSALQTIFGQPNIFTNFVVMVSAVMTSVFSFMVLIAQYAYNFATVIVSVVTWFFTYFFSVIWGIIQFFVLSPSFNVFTVISTVFGISFAWLGGTTYVNGWGQVYDFSYTYNFTFLGLHGGISIFMVMFVFGFFIQIMRCFASLSLDPILQPIGLAWAFIGFMIRLIEMMLNVVIRIIQVLITIVNALANIIPRPFGL